MEKILGIIPARGGSKSIPRKNIKPFCGKPLIAWKIEAARGSGIFDRIIVSTDDAEIAEVARAHGAEVPFMRPQELAQDTTPTLPVLQHAVKYLKDAEGYNPAFVSILEPTTPGVQPFHLREAAHMLIQTGADSVMSVVEVPTEYNYQWQFTLGPGGEASLVSGTPIKRIIRRRQDLPKTYYRNSAIYVFRTSLLTEDEPSFYGSRVYGYPMEKRYSMDLDKPEDWEEAQRQFAGLAGNGNVT